MSDETVDQIRQMVASRGASDGRGATVAAPDGFDLWFEAMGPEQSTGIIFLARNPQENRSFAEALSDTFRTVVFEERGPVAEMVQAARTMEPGPDKDAAMAHLEGRNLFFDDVASDTLPIDLLISDLHAVADAAGLDRFVLAGYSGTAHGAAVLATQSERAIGVIGGGWDMLLTRIDFWKGAACGMRMLAVGVEALGIADDEAGRFLRNGVTVTKRMVDFQETYDRFAALGALPGPKMVWFGSIDGAPSDAAMELIFPGSENARAIREAKDQYEKLGFDVVELDGLGHIEAARSPEIVPHMREALAKAGLGA